MEARKQWVCNSIGADKGIVMLAQSVRADRRGSSCPMRRRGAASVEMAFVMLYVLGPLMIGIWEMGRAVQVQQIVTGAAREGARLAAQGRTISENGTPTAIQAAIDPAGNITQQANVKAAVYQTLVGGGLDNLKYEDVTVTFSFLSGGGTNPADGVKSQPISVKVSVDFAKVRWVNLGLINPSKIEYTATWRMMVDDPFGVNTTLPGW